jgi:hypothetical protein
MKLAVTALLFIALSASALAQVAYAHGTAKSAGCEVTLPADVVANVTPTEETSHGFALDLTRPGDEHDWERTPMRYIAFNTLWDLGDMPNLESAIENMTRELGDLVPSEVRSSGPIRLVSTLPAKLGELPARRLILEFTNSEKKPAMKQVIIAYRARPDASGMIYVASLTTTRLNFQQDVTLFAKLLSGFKLTRE